MTAPNNNYVSSYTGFSDQDFAEAASIAQFNAAADVDFMAFCLFLLNGQYQVPLQNSNASPQFLWGNIDVPNNTGWALRIATGGAPLLGAAEDPILVAEVGTGAAIITAQLPLSLSTVVPGIGVTSSYVERLILAIIGFKDDGVNQRVMLSANGAVAESVAVPAPYGASALAPRLGFSPGGTFEAHGTDIVGCGYIRGAGLLDPNPAGFFSNAFRTARADFQTAFITGLGSLDWVHRWQANSPDQGIIAKSAVGAFAQQLPAAPAVVVDSGNSGVNNNAITGLTEPGINLNVTGTLRVDQRRNPDWFAGGGAPFRGVAG